jgi:hypothetical protein
VTPFSEICLAVSCAAPDRNGPDCLSCHWGHFAGRSGISPLPAVTRTSLRLSISLTASDFCCFVLPTSEHHNNLLPESCGSIRDSPGRTSRYKMWLLNRISSKTKLSGRMAYSLWLLTNFLFSLAETQKTQSDYFVHSLPGQPDGPLLKMHAG